MTGRERFLTVLNNEKPDRMPCQVHSWMQYYLQTFLGGIDQYQAYDYFGMDPVIYADPVFSCNDRDLAKWVVKGYDMGTDSSGNHCWQRVITTPEGDLMEKGAYNKFTGWTTEHIIKSERDFELWNKYIPIPTGIDWTPVREAKKRIGEKGIVRGGFFGFGQCSPWQGFAGCLYPVEDAIMATYDSPEWVHHVLDSMLQKTLRVIEMAGKIELDLVETGGGAGSSTVISPNLHREFCLPYDKRQHEALHQAGTKAVYHLCGGLMPLLDIVAENGADGLETMTPIEMGGDCDLAEAAKRVGHKLFFIGGFDQSGGFENGDPKTVKEMVYKLFSARPEGGYICSPSDHFFVGNPENIKAFVEAVKECTY
jgi:uroporphyrinogen decarboxylase